MGPDDGTAGKAVPTGKCPVCSGVLTALEGISVKFECQGCGLELQTEDQPRPITPAVICKIFEISKSTLLRWERESKIPPVQRLGKARAYGSEHFEAMSKLTGVDVPENLALVLEATILIGEKNLGRTKEVLEQLGVVLSEEHYRPYTT